MCAFRSKAASIARRKCASLSRSAASACLRGEMSAMVNSFPAAYLRWASRSSQTFRYRLQRSLNQPTVGACASLTFDELKIAPSVGVMSVEVVDGRIRTIRSIVNPDKLRHIGRVRDLGSVLRSPRRSS